MSGKAETMTAPTKRHANATASWDTDEEVTRFSARLNDYDYEYLSHILTGDTDDDVLTAAVRAAYHWGIDSAALDPSDPDWIRAEHDTLVLAKVIRAGLGDGRISVNTDEQVLIAPDSRIDPNGAAVLDRLLGMLPLVS